MTTVTITRKEYEMIKKVFEMYDTIDCVKLHFDHSNGIGPVVTLEYNPGSIKVDITDIESW